MTYLEWLTRIDSQHIDLWEAEVLDLAKLATSGVLMPASFVVSPKVYEEFFTSRAVAPELSKVTKGLSPRHHQVFAGVAESMRKSIQKATFSSEISQSFKSYVSDLQSQAVHVKNTPLRLLFTGCGPEKVVLSQYIKNAAEFEKAIKQLFSLLFTDDSLMKRVMEKSPVIPAAFSIIIQHCPEQAFSGEAICHDAENLDDNTIVIKAWAYHSAAVESADIFRVDRKQLLLLSRDLQNQWWAEDAKGNFVSPNHLKHPLHLSDEQVIKLSRQIKQGQSIFEAPVRFKWVYTGTDFLITQVTQIVTPPTFMASDSVQPLLEGIGGTLGRTHGVVRLIHSKKDHALVQEGDVVVVEHLTVGDAEWVQRAVAIVTEVGNKLSPESQLASYLMIPAVVGTGNALSRLKNGQMITVDATAGVVYQGKVATSTTPIKSQLPVTGTKIYSTVTDPYRLPLNELSHSDGVGLMRGEFIIRLLGIHPRDILNRNLAQEYKELLSEGICRVLQSVAPHPVIYQLHDLTSMDLLGLRGRHHDRHEPNPSMGYRGAHKLLEEPEVLNLELEALADIACHGMEALHIMVPMVRTLSEVKRIKTYLEASDLAKALPIKLWVKCETPGLLIQMEELCALGITGVCFDVPTLTQFIQGIDKENRQVAHHLDATDTAVEQALGYAIATCRSEGVSTMVVAEMESLRPEVIQRAVQAGLTSISVSPDQVVGMHDLIASIEQRMLLDHLVDCGN